MNSSGASPKEELVRVFSAGDRSGVSAIASPRPAESHELRQPEDPARKERTGMGPWHRWSGVLEESTKVKWKRRGRPGPERMTRWRS